MKKTLRIWLLLCLIGALFLSAFPVVAVEKTERAVPIANVDIPAYVGGNITKNWLYYDCGRGATLEDTSVQSKMCIITNTNKVEFGNYVNTLLDSGYTKVFSRKLTGNIKENIFGKFLAKDGSHSVYIALFQYLNQVRVIVDNHKDTLGTYHYAPTGDSPTELYMYSLSQSHDGYVMASEEDLITQYRSGAGSMFVMKMSDNSLFIIDGGSSNQNGDRACAELYSFLRSITSVPEGQRMVINTWHISHPHSDHVTGFTRFLRKYRNEFELKTILYNFDIECDTFNYIQAVAKMFPDVKYYKPHTGDRFTVSGIQFDVLYTAEDRYQSNSDNKLILNDSSCIAYTHENNISTVLQFQLDGKKVLLTGDLQKADATLMAMYAPSVLKSDVMQIPHHGIDNHTELAKVVAPSVAFSNQTWGATINQQRYYNNYLGWSPYIGKIYYAGSETVGYSGEKGVFYQKPFTGYDYLNWGANIRTLGKENPQNGENPVKDPESYYRYSKADAIGTSYKPYIFVDNKVGQVLSFDAINGGVSSALPAFTDGEYYFFSDSQRRLVHWNIKAQGNGTQADAAVPSAVTTYYDRVKIRKGEGDYWGTSTKGHAMTFAEDDSFSATGLYGSWASMSQQLEENTWAVWMDKLSDGTFVIYRYLDGSYYPMYRDGTFAAEKGWGIAKMTKSKLNSTLEYVKLRLYQYEATPSSMLLSWTGHKDYYLETGLSQKELTTLLLEDIRVNYSFDAFSGGGEIFHCSRDDQKPGTFWFVFDPAYNASVAGDYSVTIRYKTAKGTTLDVGSFTVHLTAKAAEEQELFFGFGDTDADRDRYYTQTKYGGTNFDGTTRWVFRTYDDATSQTVAGAGSVNREDGTLNITVDTAKSYFAQVYSGSDMPLKWNPQSAQVVQIRFKTENLKAESGKTPSFRLWYSRTDGTTTERVYEKESFLGADLNYDGNYITLTAPLFTEDEIAAGAGISGFPATTMAKAGTVQGIELGFYNFVVKEAGQEGSIVVDYVYIGSEEEMPGGPSQPVVDSNLEMYHSLNLASDISITFAVPKTQLAGYDSYYLECVLPEYEGNTKIGTSTVQIQPVDNGNYYYFTLNGITAVRMGDMVEAVLHMSKGGVKYISKTDSYSVATYAYAMLGSTKDTKMLTLCADLLRYGAEAQSFKGYRTDTLVDAAMTATHRSYLSNTDALSFTATDSSLGDLANPAITWVGKTLDLGSKVGMKFVFNATNYSGDVSKLSMKVSYTGSNGEPKTVAVTDAAAYGSNGSYYSFTFYGLAASELRTVVDVAIYNGNTRLSQTLRYSAESYASKAPATLEPLTCALFAYSDSAKAYFTK